MCGIKGTCRQVSEVLLLRGMGIMAVNASWGLVPAQLEGVGSPGTEGPTIRAFTPLACTKSTGPLSNSFLCCIKTSRTLPGTAALVSPTFRAFNPHWKLPAWPPQATLVGSGWEWSVVIPLLILMQFKFILTS